MEELTIDRFDQPKLEAIVEMMLLAASADGDFAPEERERLERNIQTLTSRRVQGPGLSELLSTMAENIAKEGRAARLEAVKTALGDAGTRKVALDLALQVMKEDGVMRTSERELVLEIAEAFEIDRDEVADMVRAIGG
jgi:tellurite resistance protein